MLIRKFKTKPTVIEAVQFDGIHEQALEIEKWSNGIVKAGVGSFNGYASEVLRVRIGCIPGESIASEIKVADPNYWIIKNEDGEFLPCKPEDFMRMCHGI